MLIVKYKVNDSQGERIIEIPDEYLDNFYINNENNSYVYYKIERFIDENISIHSLIHSQNDIFTQIFGFKFTDIDGKVKKCTTSKPFTYFNLIDGKLYVLRATTKSQILSKLLSYIILNYDNLSLNCNLPPRNVLIDDCIRYINSTISINHKKSKLIDNSYYFSFERSQFIKLSSISNIHIIDNLTISQKPLNLPYNTYVNNYILNGKYRILTYNLTVHTALTILQLESMIPKVTNYNQPILNIDNNSNFKPFINHNHDIVDLDNDPPLPTNGESPQSVNIESIVVPVGTTATSVSQIINTVIDTEFDSLPNFNYVTDKYYKYNYNEKEVKLPIKMTNKDVAINRFIKQFINTYNIKFIGLITNYNFDYVKPKKIKNNKFWILDDPLYNIVAVNSPVSRRKKFIKPNITVNTNVSGYVFELNNIKIYYITKDNKTKVLFNVNDSIDYMKIPNTALTYNNEFIKAIKSCFKIRVNSVNESINRFGAKSIKQELLKTKSKYTDKNISLSIHNIMNDIKTIDNWNNDRILVKFNEKIVALSPLDITFLIPSLKGLNKPKDKTIKIGTICKIIDDSGILSKTLKVGDIVLCNNTIKKDKYSYKNNIINVSLYDIDNEQVSNVVGKIKIKSLKYVTNKENSEKITNSNECFVEPPF